MEVPTKKKRNASWTMRNLVTVLSVGVAPPRRAQPHAQVQISPPRVRCRFLQNDGSSASASHARMILYNTINFRHLLTIMSVVLNFQQRRLVGLYLVLPSGDSLQLCSTIWILFLVSHSVSSLWIFYQPVPYMNWITHSERFFNKD